LNKFWVINARPSFFAIRGELGIVWDQKYCLKSKSATKDKQSSKHTTVLKMAMALMGRSSDEAIPHSFRLWIVLIIPQWLRTKYCSFN
jgi:hypothetical protein